jgi:transcriptional regulator NrdR family protein
MNCTKCGKFEAYIIESRLRASGARYRRYSCNACGNRWSTYQTADLQAKPVPSRKLAYRALSLRRVLTNWEAAEILMAQDLSIRELAAKYQISHQAVHSIRAGRTYREVYCVLNPH